MWRLADEPVTNGVRIVRIALVLIIIPVFAVCEEGAPCRDCGDAMPDAADAMWLESQGFPLDVYRLLLSWDEAAVGDAGLVRGFHLLAPEGGPFDVYQGPNGDLLGIEDLPALGISPKTWDLQPLLLPPEVTRGSTAGKGATETPERAPTQDSSPEFEISLPALDNAALKQEDEREPAYPNKGVMRFGVTRELPQSLIADGSNLDAPGWDPAPSTRDADAARSWRARVESPGALGMRVHFAEIRLPAGSEISVWNALDTCEGYSVRLADDTWSPTCFTSQVDIIVTVPAGTSVFGTHVSIDSVTHSYRGLGELPWKGKAGSCNLDIACYADWSAAALGVGGIGSVGEAGALWCTGSLIVDADPATDIPYFLTANHCVPTVPTASSIEVYWLYQRPSCGGATPDPKTVPRTTDGADFLATSAVATGTDFTLLRLRNAPPAGLVALGLSSEIVPLGTLTTCIHHPSGDYKRISFGTTVNSGSPDSGGAHIQPQARFHENLWSNGTTEPGSSGSPLLLRDTQVYIGQLWGGLASCTRPEEPDYYGRFDVTFPMIAVRLGAARSPYDIDGSGSVNAADLQSAINVIIGKAQTFSGADVDRSGAVDALDLQLIILGILHSQ